jgi:hypothetical protein
MGLRSSWLGYPSAGFGVDPTHPASNKLVISAYAANGTFISGGGQILGAATTNVSLTPGVLPFGPAVKFASAGSVAQWSAMPTSLYTQATCAGIFGYLPSTGSTPQTVFGDYNQSTAGFSLRVTSGLMNLAIGSSTAIATTLPVAINTPYFVAASFLGGSIINVVLINLNTGATYSQAITTSVPANTASAGGFIAIGNSAEASGQTRPLLGSAARFMRNNTFLTMPMLLQWAANPWAFWHPAMKGQGLNFGIGAPAAGAVFNPAWAMNANWLNGARTGT